MGEMKRKWKEREKRGKRAKERGKREEKQVDAEKGKQSVGQLANSLPQIGCGSRRSAPNSNRFAADNWRKVFFLPF